MPYGVAAHTHESHTRIGVHEPIGVHASTHDPPMPREPEERATDRKA